jgi:integral membrane protein
LRGSTKDGRIAQVNVRTPSKAPENEARAVLHGALIRYRVMAYTTAVLLIVLVFVGVPLQLAAGRPRVVNVVGTVHGFCYIVYLFTAFDLTRKLHLTFGKMVLVLLAGTVPFCAIVAERLLTRFYERSTADLSLAPLEPGIHAG